MPWPMVHFAIATEIYSQVPASSFLIGSIAPDAIHVRDGVTRKDKGFTHLVQDEQLPSAEHILHTCLEYWKLPGGTEWKEFVRGYFSHIYADLRWTQTLYNDFERHVQAEKHPIREIYNKEVSQIEFILLREIGSSQEVISQLKKAKAFTIKPFLMQDEIHKYRDQKISWLEDRRNEPNIKPVYFTEEKVRCFVTMVADELKDLFQKLELVNVEAAN